MTPPRLSGLLCGAGLSRLPSGTVPQASKPALGADQEGPRDRRSEGAVSTLNEHLRNLTPTLTLLLFAFPLLAALCFGCATQPSGPKRGSEAYLIGMLSSHDLEEVYDALARLPEKYPDSTNAVRVISGMLGDSKVRRQAARSLGHYRAELDVEHVRLILGLLHAYDPNEVMDGLKALRGLREPQPIVDLMVAQMIPLLKDKNDHVVRDTCITLAVHGNKDTIPHIEPLLTRIRWDVKKDATEAIAALRAKE